jgi:transcription elongation factor GreA
VNKVMANREAFLTPEGAQKLREELEHLTTVRRQELAARLRAAIQQGDLSENADYTDAKNEQAFLEGRIQLLEETLRNASIIQSQGPSDVVRIGSQVLVSEDGTEPEEFHIVGPMEADPRQGRISHESPLGQALLGRREGDTFTIDAPAGQLIFRVVTIR